MLSNYLKISLRFLQKNRIYSVINVVGLVIGIAAALLLFRIVKFESGFNQHFENYDHIVRVIQMREDGNAENRLGTCIPIPAMDQMEESVHQFSHISRIREMWSTLTVPEPELGTPQKKFSVDRSEVSFFVENDFFSVFDFEWLAGNPSNALVNPGTIVLTREWATKCFDTWETAMGKTVMIDNIIPAKVEGVIEDLPKNCDFPLQYLVSYETLKSHPDLFFYSTSWGSCSSNNQVYALLKPDAGRDATNATLRDVGKEEYSERNDGVQDRFHAIQPLSDLHYNEDLGHSGTHHMSRSRIRVLSMIGILILIIACFNFINMATAQASLRIKEVGVRKTLGGQRWQLIGQFLSETGILVCISVVVGALIAHLSMPLLRLVSHFPAEVSLFSDPSVYLFLFIAAIVLTLLAGLYPSVLLSGFKPVVALQSNTKKGLSGKNYLAKTLIVLQFAIAQTLIISAAFAILQMDYIRSKDLGFSNDLIYTFSFNNDTITIARQNALKLKLLQINTVENVSFSSDQPLSGNTWASNFRYSDRPEDEQYSITIKFCDENYRETYGIEMLAGEWFSRSDTIKDAVINETLIEKLGLQDPAEAVGQKITLGSSRQITIRGVAKDFHTHSLRSAHLPLIMTTRKEYYWEAGVKMRPTGIDQTLAKIQSAYDEVLPEQVFNGNFLDERIAQYYEDDERMTNTTKAFGLLAIFISCLGLFGLATHAAALRIKEIGIRKVLGASISGIVALLSADFIKLVSLSFIIASPLAYWIIQQWLDNFVYRIPIFWWVFAITGLTSIAVAFLTVSYQSVRAALANPVKALRSE